MAETKKKNYIKGSAKEHVFDNGGSVIHIDMKLEDLKKIANERGYVKVTVSKLKQTDDYGNTHSVYENDYKPAEKKAAPAAKTPLKAKAKDTLPGDDLPF